MYQLPTPSKLKGLHFLGVLDEGSRNTVGPVGVEAGCAEAWLARLTWDEATHGKADMAYTRRGSSWLRWVRLCWGRQLAAR